MPKKILIADDQPDTVKILSINLKAAGYSVVTASSGQEAYDRICVERPELAILDICMPQMDGTEVAARLKQDTALARIPIIFLTGLGKAEDEPQPGEESSEYVIFSKPFNANKIVDKVRQILGDGE